ncbi:trypsin-like serine peptidase [Wenxinia marina]|uniref:V8-like Glu-specific endopeptidase n=1 Tax=Wenxinia marina DSM 24838 TaxID=1123501 RepID=A0A0D0NI22_9RHOB|nr:trypsin-like peptidase domain-containing protein [Wenxinia marina]KIQ67985.1 V8-like Glu-specific endopeptidase [Wenxinia marina DSM 24838]GGL75636.1 serine protease [Wenxinia marina]
MRRALALLALIAGLAGPAAADSDLVQFRTIDDARGWEAVGRLEIGTRGFCTATLIAPDVVLTAAHCMFDADTRERIPDVEFTFRAGLRDGRALAERTVRRSAIPQGYDYGGRDWTDGSARDLAVLELDQPIRTPAVQPIPPLGGLLDSLEVGIVSYAHDRAEAPSLQERCGVMGSGSGVYVLTCSVDFGSSGSPVFQMDATGAVHVAAVVSAKATLDGQRVAIGAPLGVELEDLLSALRSGGGFQGTAPGGIRVLAPGERTDLGARFVRP